jgi:hypothetical protein
MLLWGNSSNLNKNIKSLNKLLSFEKKHIKMNFFIYLKSLKEISNTIL